MRVTASSPAAARRQQALLNGLGFYAQTLDFPAAASTSLAATGNIYGMAVGLVAGDVVANMTVALQTVGISVTLAKLALYSITGNAQLAVSADASATMNGTTGMKTIAMAAAYTVPTDGLYYACFLAVGAGTQPTLMQGKGAVNTFQAVGSGSAQAVFQSGQSDMPSPNATLAGNASGRSFWIGIS